MCCFLFDVNGIHAWLFAFLDVVCIVEILRVCVLCWCWFLWLLVGLDFSIFMLYYDSSCSLYADSDYLETVVVNRLLVNYSRMEVGSFW